ncbi:hypothetical protein N7539_006673 [Penicillium diatomitis]|uniref:Uncharacterized protein n=1 Tax=Penicillium diatomitis TaxID=2819901 RepID=A0A9W9X1S3_9EURO|nr:uncharacterized protein N7539_006673 [Penicillium diatomitis]KAJ5480779.1 hypothetical protein N7539_006673 [Penicillium diatomitis]
MSSPKVSKKPVAERTFGLTQSEVRMMLLAYKCVESESKIDYKKLAAISNVSVSSAPVIYRRAFRKLSSFNCDVEGSGDSEENDSSIPATSGPLTPARTPKRNGGGRRRKGKDSEPDTKAKIEVPDDQESDRELNITMEDYIEGLEAAR